MRIILYGCNCPAHTALIAGSPSVYYTVGADGFLEYAKQAEDVGIVVL